MRILFILENYHPKIGGLEKLFKSLIETLLERGHSVSILTNGTGVNKPWIEKSGNLKVYRLPFLNRYLFTLLAVIPGIWLAAKHDLIHTTSYNAGIPSWLAAKITRTKVVITFHEVWADLWYDLPFFSRFSKKLHYRFEQFLLTLPFHFFVAPSDFTHSRLVENGVPTDKIKRIYNGLDYAKYELAASVKKTPIADTYAYLYFGRLGISKGLEILLKAAEILLREEQDFGLTLVLPKQPKPLLNKIKRLIHTYDLASAVTMLHHLPEPDLIDLVRASDCVVIPSYSEGFCFVAAETVALGTPIVSSGRGALQEVVSGKHITYSNQSAEDLAEGMSQAKHGYWTETPLKTFLLEDSVSRYVELYDTINSTP